LAVGLPGPTTSDSILFLGSIKPHQSCWLCGRGGDFDIATFGCQMPTLYAELRPKLMN